MRKTKSLLTPSLSSMTNLSEDNALEKKNRKFTLATEEFQ